MLNKLMKQSRNLKILSVLVVTFLVTFSGCKSNLLSEQDAPSQALTQPQAPPAPVVVEGVRTSYADVVEKTSPAVVMIRSERKTKTATQQFPFADDPQFREFFKGLPQQQQGQQRPQIERGLGSGVIVNADGTVLTNHHVIEGAEKITVQMNDDRTFEAKVVGSDPPSDLAVLKIEGGNLPYLNLGNSDNVRIGDIVLAIGNPLGIGQTVTAGIISAKGRRTGLSDGNSSFEDFLQTDAPINRGNSGGALINLSGELIGINSQILSDSGGGGNIGIGFSIPTNMAKSVMDQLLKDGKVHRGMLGVNIQNITEETAKALDLKNTKGVLVSNVQTGSSAEKAGVKRGDIVVAINGEAIEDSNTLRNKVAGTQPGSEIKLTVVRDGSEQELTAKLDEFKSQGVTPDGSHEESKESRKSDENGKLGVSLQPLTPEMAKQLNIPADTEGLIVTDIDPNGAAAEEGITKGDVIMEINRKQVTSVDDVQSALEKSGDKPILLLISRKGQTIYLTVKPN